jgi:hypothetical protein
MGKIEAAKVAKNSVKMWKFESEKVRRPRAGPWAFTLSSFHPF